jgi:hypothetical protein
MAIIDSIATKGNPFHPFEGFWLATKPSGVIAYAKVINGKLLIPYSYSGQEKLNGHYFDCRVVGKTLFCRFEQFDTAVAGVLFLDSVSNETLKGGRWLNTKIPDEVQQDISSIPKILPGMQSVVWVRMNKETPQWAEKYFTEDWPNKPII